MIDNLHEESETAHLPDARDIDRAALVTTQSYSELRLHWRWHQLTAPSLSARRSHLRSRNHVPLQSNSLYFNQTRTPFRLTPQPAYRPPTSRLSPARHDHHRHQRRRHLSPIIDGTNPTAERR